MEQSIKYLLRHEIDRGKWDECIQQSTNGVIYATSIYLDHMCTNWSALVLNDYEAVFPLPWRKKWTISYIYQPFLVAQLGAFGRNISLPLFNDFLSAIPRVFRLIDIPLNQQNVFPGSILPLYLRTNYVLPLDQPYDDLCVRYRDNIKRNIKRAKQVGCFTKKGIPSEDVLALAKEQHSKDEDGLERFARLYAQFRETNTAITYGIYSNQQQLLASAVFLFYKKRAYYILVGNHPNGRTLGASHLLIDSFIRDHAGSDLLLDFEGSDYKNLAFFYSSFGAVEEKYAALRYNRLPWFARWLKSKAPHLRRFT